MSDGTCDFNNMETFAFIIFFLQGKEPKEIHAILRETVGKHVPSYDTVKNWVTQFKRDDFSTCDALVLDESKQCPPRSLLNKIHELILEERRISAK
jgi:hypothetical protein